MGIVARWRCGRSLIAHGRWNGHGRCDSRFLVGMP
jgi:hypothetical protein